MRQNFVRNIIFGVTALSLIGASLLAMHIVVHADSSQRVTLTGQTVPLVQEAQLLQAKDPSQQLDLSVGLQLRNQADLDSMLAEIYNPQSAQYHQFLTPDQFNQLFAPTSDQVQQVAAFLQNQGLTITTIAPNNMLINASGTVGQIQQAFSTQINNYQLGGNTFYGNAAPPSVPAAISNLISSIGGLDNSQVYHPLFQKATAAGNPARHWKRPGSTSQSHGITISLASATPAGLGPKDLATAYDSAPLQATGMLGDNQTIAVFELDGYQQSDLQQYFQNYNLGNPNISNVLVDNFNGSAGQGAIEAELDIEVVAGLAPHANQLVYEGPNTIQGINDTYNKIVTDNKAQVATISWGLCETNSGSSELQTLDNIFKQGSAQGISFFAAAGDSGAYDCADNNLAVDSPASDPYVTGVGGTTLQLNAGVYNSESVWSNATDTHRSPKGAGGGGGISNTFSLPNWQSGPGVQNQYTNGKREVPDVTAAADPGTGYAMYCTVGNAGCPASGWLTVGGTSAGAPLWAGNALLINQYLLAQGKSRVGAANPALYNISATNQQYPAFHDITTGTNLYYPATTNYDMSSGLGSPDVYNLARDLVASPLVGTPTPTATNTPTPTPTQTPSPTPTSSPPLIQNSGFENGQSPWRESSSGGYQMVDTSNPHVGTYSVYFCGYMSCDDRIWQLFTVPASYTKITVTYWWYSDTNKTTNKCLDAFNSQLQTSSGSPIRTMQQSCNTDATNSWVQQSYEVTKDLASYKGKQVSLFFRGTNASNQYQTSDFFVDDVVITVS